MFLKSSIISELVVKVIIVVVLLIGILIKVPYNYFIFLRYAVTFGCLILIYFSVLNKSIGQLLGLIGIALTFNPLFKVWFEREIWVIVDLIVISFLIITGIYNWKKQHEKTGTN